MRKFLLSCFVLIGCSSEPPHIESPRPATPSSLEVHSTSEVASWSANLLLDENGKLVRLTVSCNGTVYAEAEGGEDIPQRTIGAQIEVYRDANCERGSLELAVFALGDAQNQGVPGTYIPTIFYFSDGDFLGRSDVRDIEEPQPPPG